ncbi:MAG: dipeptide epimerase [Campylobacteraceae bacterium]|jgi:o-succinylbenzoate synthase|nr:dipeptide epimerase [Campylobacteraceae bacterium]
MKITDFKLSIIKSELKKPFVTNIRRVDAIEDVLLTLITDDGTKGYGEAPPTVAITGEDIGTIEKTIKERIFPAIKGLELGGNDIFEALHASVTKSTSAKACVDMAIYDILAKSANKPLYEYLGGKAKTLRTNLTISLGSPEVMLKDAIEAYNDGFSVLKVKVGTDKKECVEAMQSIRAALPSAILRVDANQAWDAKTALDIIESIAPLGIELVEQPTCAEDLAGLAEITAHSSIPILADESVFDYEDAVRILDGRMADYINIKLMKTGGIYEAIKIAALAKERGAKVMMGSMLESVVSISAAVHFAMSDDNICFYDLDGPLLAKPSSVKNALIFEKDEITVSECIGLGVKL